MLNARKKTVAEFLNEDALCLTQKSHQELKKEIRATEIKCASQGLHDLVYLSQVNDLMINNLRVLIKDILNAILLSSEKLISSDNRNIEDILNKKIDIVLEKYENILKEEDRANVLSKDGVETKFKQKLQDDTKSNLFFLLNKFNADLCNKKAIKKIQKRAAIAFWASIASGALTIYETTFNSLPQLKNVVLKIIHFF